MRYLLWAFSGIVVVTCCYCSASRQVTSMEPAHSESELSVLSYNIHHANPPAKPGVIDVNAIAAVINRIHPSLVALQEIDVYTHRSGANLHEAITIGQLTGMKVYFGKSIDYDGGSYGVAVLSTFPVAEFIVHRLPTMEGTNGEPRVLAMARINLPSKGDCWFACTHLDAQKNDTNRIAQISEILSVFRDEPMPVILAGDLNAVPGSRVIDSLDAYFKRTCPDSCTQYSIPNLQPNKVIDYIAVKPADAFRLLSHEVIDEQYASDHLPVLARFRW